MTPEQIEQDLETRLQYLHRRETEVDISFDAYLQVYQALAQVRQAMAVERIAARLDAWNASGIPVENVH